MVNFSQKVSIYANCGQFFITVVLVTQVKLIVGFAQMQFVWPILFRVKKLFSCIGAA
jgi:hypothetical protein